MKAKDRLAVGLVAAVCFSIVSGTIYLGQQRLLSRMSQTSPQLDPETCAKYAKELLSVVRESGESGAREWLLKHGAAVSAQVVLSYDNSSDPAGNVRTGLLATIYSVGSEELSDDELRTWAQTLRELASVVLHDGPERMDYLAKSFIMEGRDKEAAAEYAHFPNSPQASHFFHQNPYLRMPASGVGQ